MERQETMELAPIPVEYQTVSEKKHREPKVNASDEHLPRKRGYQLPQEEIQGARPKYNISMEGYSYSHETLDIKYQNADGDYLELSYSAENYKSLSVNAQGEIGNEDMMKDWLENVRDFLLEQEKRLLDIIFNNEDSMLTSGVKQGAASKEIDPAQVLGIPEYWNAENTSQRIVDFATSFYQAFEGSSEEYGSIIIDAVKKGFEEAKGIIGPISGPAADLLADTEALTFEKLDQWVKDNARQHALAA